MAVNSMGFQLLADGGTPDSFSALAVAAVSGGQFAYAGSKAAAVTSGAVSFVTSDIWVNVSASGTNYPIGIVQSNTGSNTYATIYKRGVFIVPTDGAMQPTDVASILNGNDAVSALASGGSVHWKVGRVYTGASSGGHVVLNLEL